MKKSEHILILGLGGMGHYLARRLSHGGHHVTGIEPDPERIRKVEGELDARLICGDATDFKCWEEAQAKQMDYVIAVTDDDAVNILASLIADRLGIRQKICRIRSIAVWSDEAVLNEEDLKINLVIRPEELAAQEIARLLKTRAGNVLVDVGVGGQLQVVAAHVQRHSLLAQSVIKDLSKEHPDLPFQIVCVARDIETFIPSGDFKILPDDHVFILAQKEHIPRVMELGGLSETRRHRVLIVGGGWIGARVAELLQDTYPVRLIERDERRAEALSHQLKRTECLHGDGSDRDTLLQAGLLRMNTVIATTGNNETNIMTSVLAKHLLQTRTGTELDKTIAVVEREEYLVLASAMGIDIAVNQKLLAANVVLRYIRREYVLSVAHLHGCEAEVVELLVALGSPITKKPLYAIEGLKNKIMIGAVYRDGTWEIARGSTQFIAGDRVVCVCGVDHLGDLQNMFLS